MTEENKIRDVIDATTGLVKAVPVYEDAIQPAAKEVGKSLETAAKAVNVALAPVSALVWGYETIKDFVSTRVAEKLRYIPADRIVSPKPHVVVPALEALRYTGHEESLRELYANLLATSLDADTAHRAHPAFVDMIKSMSTDEARIMRLFSTQTIHPSIDILAYSIVKQGSYEIIATNISFIGKEAGCDCLDLIPNCLDNLSRLGLLLLPNQSSMEEIYIADESCYQPLEADSFLKKFKDEVDKMETHEMRIKRRFIKTTSLGMQFCAACVIDKNIVDADPI